MFTSSFILSVLLGAQAALAFPAINPTLTGCSLANAKIDFPAGQTALAVPTTAPSFVGLGVGVQNYTCNATSSTYVSTGAVAELFDISCLVNTPMFKQAGPMAFDFWTKSSMTAQQLIQSAFQVPVAGAILGQHYFIKNVAGALVPKWDFTSSGAKTKGNKNAFVVGAKDGALNTPTVATDVPWLQLHGVDGKLATAIYRVDTKGGQPPASCKAGSKDISVKYTSNYYLFGSQL